jgi:2-iminobutanoate/2-iminopropanoate deaminase
MSKKQIIHTSEAPVSLVSATFILGEEADFPGMNQEWAKWFPNNPPARQGAKLPIRPKGMKISIAVVAVA